MPRGGYKEGGGRRKGSLNKLSRTVKETIEWVSNELGGQERLLAWVRLDPENESIFWEKIWLKLLPLNVNMDMSDRLATFMSRIDGQNRNLPSLPPSVEVIEDENRTKFDA